MKASRETEVDAFCKRRGEKSSDLQSTLSSRGSCGCPKRRYLVPDCIEELRLTDLPLALREVATAARYRLRGTPTATRGCRTSHTILQPSAAVLRRILWGKATPGARRGCRRILGTCKSQHERGGPARELGCRECPRLAMSRARVYLRKLSLPRDTVVEDKKPACSDVYASGTERRRNRDSFARTEPVKLPDTRWTADREGGTGTQSTPPAELLQHTGELTAKQTRHWQEGELPKRG